MAAVTTFEEFKAAFLNDATVQVGADIVLEEPLATQVPNQVVRGIGPAIEISAKPLEWKPEDGDNQLNALRSSGENWALQNLRFVDFDHDGSLIKGHVRQTLQVLGCYFERIGIKRMGKRETRAGARASQVISQHGWRREGMEQSEPCEMIRVENCRFVNCITHENNHAHLVYASAAGVRLFRGIETVGCGNPFTANANGYAPDSGAGRLTIVENSFFNANAVGMGRRHGALAYAVFRPEPLRRIGSCATCG